MNKHPDLKGQFAIVKRCMQCGSVNPVTKNACNGCNQLMIKQVPLTEIPVDYME